MFVPTPRYRLHCWGDFALLDPEGVQATPRSRKTRALLAWLAFHPDRPVSRERLAGLLWGDRGDEQARSSLRQALFALKGLAHGPDALLHVDRNGVTLRGERLEREPWPNPSEGEILFANLDDIDEGFDDWLRIARAREAGEAAGRTGPGPEPDPVRPGEPSPAPQAGRTAMRSPRHLPWIAAAFFLLVAALGAMRFWPDQAAKAGEQVTLAVLPFKPGTGPDDPMQADALAAALRREFRSSDRMQTLGSVSSSLPDLAALSPVEAGRRLGATHVLTGSVTNGSSGTSASVRLAQTIDGSIVWSERFEVGRNGTIGLKDQIAAGVRASLGIAKPARPTISSRADVYALVASARELMNTLEPAKLEAAVLLLRKAVALDPDDPSANAELAIALLDLRLFEPPEARNADRLAEADTYARRAYRLAPELAEAQAAMGFLLEWSDHPEASLPYYAAAVRLDPGRAGFWVHIANVQRHVGRYGEGLAALRRAVALEPLWWPAFYQSAELAWNLGNRAESNGLPRTPFAALTHSNRRWCEATSPGERGTSRRPGARASGQRPSAAKASSFLPAGPWGVRCALQGFRIGLALSGPSIRRRTNSKRCGPVARLHRLPLPNSGSPGAGTPKSVCSFASWSMRTGQPKP